MADVSYAEALQAELNDAETVVSEAKEKVTVFPDSEGDLLSAGDRVHVSDVAEFGWDENAEVPNERKFDFGRVDTLNDDGTVNVAWDSAMCGCSGQERSRVEKSQDLTLTTESAVYLYYKGLQDGNTEGREGFQEELRELLGLEKETSK